MPLTGRGTGGRAGLSAGPGPINLRMLLLLCCAVAALLLPTAAAQKCGPLKLLAIGDSITKGSIPSQQRNTPYADFTKDKLRDMLGGCFDVQASTAALGGSGVFVRNGQTLPEFARPQLYSSSWDFVLVMAGINGEESY